jgi:hypothetical protein
MPTSIRSKLFWCIFTFFFFLDVVGTIELSPVRLQVYKPIRSVSRKSRWMRTNKAAL